MGCIKAPSVPLPTLPSPLSLTPPAIPQPPQIPGLCCKMPPIPPLDVPIPIPVLTIPPAVIATLRGYIAAAVAYVNSLPIKCPTE